jgi:hypothetical protein
VVQFVTSPLVLWHRCQELLSSFQARECPPAAILTPSGAIHPNRLVASAVKLAAVLRRPVPNVNGELLILKCCAELRMPEVLCEVEVGAESLLADLDKFRQSMCIP